MKYKDAKVEVDRFVGELKESIAKWKYGFQNGVGDSSWPDGVNLNLVRNHCIYYKRQIREICEKENMQRPQEMFLPLPPEIDDNYFAKNSPSKDKVTSFPDWKGYTSQTADKHPERYLSSNQMSLF